MSINKKVAVAYIEKFDAGLDLRKKRDFIRDYIAASNAHRLQVRRQRQCHPQEHRDPRPGALQGEQHQAEPLYHEGQDQGPLYRTLARGSVHKDLESHVLYKTRRERHPGYPYCVAITMYPFLVDGLIKLGGVSVAPTDLKSFCGEFINLVYSISSQFMGAVATPEFLMYLDYFIRKDYGDDYLDHLEDVVEMNAKKRTLVKVIDNYFQQVVHSMSMPAGTRGYQTVFWNISYFDKSYFRGVFGDFRFPDGSSLSGRPFPGSRSIS